MVRRFSPRVGEGVVVGGEAGTGSGLVSTGAGAAAGVCVETISVSGASTTVVHVAGSLLSAPPRCLGPCEESESSWLLLSVVMTRAEKFLDADLLICWLMAEEVCKLDKYHPIERSELRAESSPLMTTSCMMRSALAPPPVRGRKATSGCVRTATSAMPSQRPERMQPAAGADHARVVPTRQASAAKAARSLRRRRRSLEPQVQASRTDAPSADPERRSRRRRSSGKSRWGRSRRLPHR